MTKLLIKKGLITESEFIQKLSAKRVGYQAMGGEDGVNKMPETSFSWPFTLASVSAFFSVYWMARTLSAIGSGVGDQIGTPCGL